MSRLWHELQAPDRQYRPKVRRDNWVHQLFPGIVQTSWYRDAGRPDNSKPIKLFWLHSVKTGQPERQKMSGRH